MRFTYLGKPFSRKRLQRSVYNFAIFDPGESRVKPFLNERVALAALQALKTGGFRDTSKLEKKTEYALVIMKGVRLVRGVLFERVDQDGVLFEAIPAIVRRGSRNGCIDGVTDIAGE